MLVTREMDYMLRILRALYQTEQMSAAAISAQEQVPKATALKLLKKLHAAGLVDSRRGVGGGYLLRVSCRQLTLYELFALMEDKIYVNRCQRPGYACEKKGDCGLRREFNRVQQVLDAELRRTPLSEIF